MFLSKYWKCQDLTLFPKPTVTNTKSYTYNDSESWIFISQNKLGIEKENKAYGQQ